MSQVVIQKNNNQIDVNVWNRVYTIDKTPGVMSCIQSNGRQLLDKPMTFYMESDGKKSTFGDGVFFKVNCNGIDGKDNVILKTFESESAVVNIMYEVFEDGCVKVDISLMPRGRSVNESLGLGNHSHTVFKPNKFYLDIPFSADCCDYYHIFPSSGIDGVGEYQKYYGMSYAGHIINDGFSAAFKEQLYISGNDCGLGFVFRDDKTWVNTDKTKVFEFFKNKDGQSFLRIHFLDDTPKVWQDMSKMLDMPPITFSFSMIATPVKEFSKDGFYERNLHIDCFKKIPREMNYDEFLAGEAVEGSGENCYDRIARLGVKVLYLHEKWNDIQNSPITTEETIERAKKIVNECHKRGIKVIPYFGYELSTLSPFFPEYSGEIWLKKNNFPYDWYWYRYPYQRDILACMNSKWHDIMYEGLTKLYDEIGFDGLYFDSLATPHGCKNLEHGCGYVDENGEVHTTYPVWEIRDFMKKIYTFVKSRGGTINVHGAGACNLLTLYYESSIWEGENFQGLLMRGEITKMPDGMLRAQFTGRDTGVPVYSLCYSNENWSFKSASAFSLLCGSLPKPVDIGEPLEQMSVLWDAFDKFPLKVAEWTPYWNTNGRVKVSDDGVKASYWETDSEMLVVLASTSADFKGKVNVQCEFKNVFDVLCGYTQISDNGSFEADFCGIDYKLLYIKK